MGGEQTDARDEMEWETYLSWVMGCWGTAWRSTTVTERASERASERWERRNYTTQKRAHVETHSAAAGGRRKIRHHSCWAVYSFTAYKLTTS
jgi:hypothetical protein